MNRFSSHLFYISAFILLLVSANENEEKKFGFLMPYVHREFDELHLCTQIRLNNSKEHYIVGFEPRATMDKIHHVVLVGCSNPPTTEPVWYCGSNSHSTIVDSEYEKLPDCADPQVLYAWARNAPILKLPPDVGFKVGGDTRAQYIVMQIHYPTSLHYNGGVQYVGTTPPPPLHLRDTSVDIPGVIIHYTDKRQKQIAKVLTLAVLENSIPPLSEGHWDIARKIDEDKTFQPFAFRVHTHHYATAVTGYRVREDSNGKHHWTLIAKVNPQGAHMWYPVANNVTVAKGDYIAARCSYNNYNNITVQQGMSDNDEACFLYLMYQTTNGEQPLQFDEFWTGPYNWEDEFNNIPEDASDAE